MQFVKDHPKKIIQPTQSADASIKNTVVTPKPVIDPAEIYPEATQQIDTSLSMQSNPSGNYWEKENISDKWVSLRVKALLALVILGFLQNLISGIYLVVLLTNGLSVPGLGAASTIVAIEIGINFYLLFSKSVSGVTLILKVLLFVSIIAVFGIFFGVGSNLNFFSILTLLLTFIALSQVKSLGKI